MTGLPKVPVEKLKMLNMFLTTKIFAKFGIDQHFKDGSYGFNDDKTMTNGYLIM